jgi:protein-tyrosine phosphatase
MGPVHDDAYRFAPAAPREDHVFGASAPGWHSACDHRVALDRWIAFMQDQRIDRVCCLLSLSRPEARESHLDPYREAFGNGNVRHVPLADRRLADPEPLGRDVLPFLADTARADERVVVQGLSGLGRTGQVLAAWLVARHGYDPDVAVDTVMGMCRDPVGGIEGRTDAREALLGVLGEFD